MSSSNKRQQQQQQHSNNSSNAMSSSPRLRAPQWKRNQLLWPYRSRSDVLENISERGRCRALCVDHR